MSDPVTNIEIEDILSSIRQLVSEDGGPRHPAPREAKRVERLVLTPALRVQDAPKPDPAPEPMLLTNPAETPAPAQPSRLARLVEQEVARALGPEAVQEKPADEDAFFDDTDDGLFDTEGSAPEVEDDPAAEIADWTHVRLSEPMSRYDHDAIGQDTRDTPGHETAKDPGDTPADETAPAEPDQAALEDALDAIEAADAASSVARSEGGGEALSLEALQDVCDDAEDDTLDLSAVLAEAETVADFGPMDRGLEAKIAALEALINSRDDGHRRAGDEAKQPAPDSDEADETDAAPANSGTNRDATSSDIAAGEDASEALSDHIDAAEALVLMMSDKAESWGSEETSEDMRDAPGHTDVMASTRPTLSVVSDEERDVWDDLADEGPETDAEPEPDAASRPEDSSARAATGPAFRHRPPEATPRHRPPEATLDWEDHAPRRDGARHVSSPHHDADREEETRQPVSQAPGDVPILDEAMLRDMVSDIVRQELQGVLGERITRNVRKLVRREIHRVMMTQEFD